MKGLCAVLAFIFGAFVCSECAVALSTTEPDCALMAFALSGAQKCRPIVASELSSLKTLMALDLSHEKPDYDSIRDDRPASAGNGSPGGGRGGGGGGGWGGNGGKGGSGGKGSGGGKGGGGGGGW